MAGSPKDGEVLICFQCQREFYAHPSNIKRGVKYCSPGCYHDFQKKKPKGIRRGKKAESRVCPVCEKRFFIGGFGAPSARQICCSRECTNLSRYRTGSTANRLCWTDAAYLAGIIDGEGSIMLYMRRDVVAMRIGVWNTYRPLIESIIEMTGIGTVLNGRAATKESKATYGWHANADAAYSVLEQVVPFLKVKHVQADFAMQVQENLRVFKLKADRGWQKTAHSLMQALNSRGPGNEVTESEISAFLYSLHPESQETLCAVNLPYIQSMAVASMASAV